MRAGEHRELENGSVELAPRGRHDLRASRGTPVTALRYPAGSVLVVAGVPGAGKSTLLHRVLGTDGTEAGPARLPGGIVVLDSEQARNRWRYRLGSGVPYPLYRPLVHAAHTLAVLRALAGGGSMVVHDCATRRWWRSMVLAAARCRGTGAHLVVLDVPAGLALEGQRRRGRTTRRRSFSRHVRRARRLVAAVTRPAPAPDGSGGADGYGGGDGYGGADRRGMFASCVVLDRGAANRLGDIGFTTDAPRDPIAP